MFAGYNAEIVAIHHYIEVSFSNEAVEVSYIKTEGEAVGGAYCGFRDS